MVGGRCCTRLTEEAFYKRFFIVAKLQVTLHLLHLLLEMKRVFSVVAILRKLYHLNKVTDNYLQIFIERRFVTCLRRHDEG